MGMDVFGRNPSAEVGKYFRNNVWYWRPLADLCQALAPDICKSCKHWQSNDGDGLDGDGATALANVLEKHLKDGSLKKFIRERERRLKAMPDETCELCDGTGSRKDELAVELGMTEEVVRGWRHPRRGQKGTCNACDSTGKVRPFATHYPCDLRNIREFATFLKASGGFNIC